jgi:hypothetical protein
LIRPEFIVDGIYYKQPNEYVLQAEQLFHQIVLEMLADYHLVLFKLFQATCAEPCYLKNHQEVSICLIRPEFIVDCLYYKRANTKKGK